MIRVDKKDMKSQVCNVDTYEMMEEIKFGIILVYYKGKTNWKPEQRNDG